MSGSKGGDGGRGSVSPLGYLGLGFELVVPLVVALYLGHRLDRWLDTGPWLLLLGAVLGMAAGFLGFFWRVLPPRGGANDTR